MLKIRAWLQENAVVATLFILLAIANIAYLDTVPGLMGDEASEGENVYEKIIALTTPDGEGDQTVLVQGERSYIGPFIDYVRIPFIALFGYTPLALRIPMTLASLAAFIVAISLGTRFFNRTTAHIIAATVFFSPIYFSQQRLGWAITLFPLFALLIIWLLTSRLKHKALLTGLVAGLALHNHILFLPTLIAILITAALYWLVGNARGGR